MFDQRELSDPRKAVQLGLGMSSPLWPSFFLAAGAGVAYWAWSHWGRKAVEAVGSPPLLEGLAPPPAADRPQPPVEASAEAGAPLLDENLAAPAALVAGPPARPPRKPRAAASKAAAADSAPKPKRAKAAKAEAASPARRGQRHS